MGTEQTLDRANLRRLQSVELSLLQALDGVCRKYDIPYFICYGTAIGAIRHQGFIPWDDDIDVGMLRSDYEKLKAAPRAEWEAAGITLADPADRFDAHLWTYPRLYKNGTVFESGSHYYAVKKPDSETGKLRIWLDIFLYDRVRSPQEADRLKRKVNRLKKEYYYAVCDRVIRKEEPFSRKLIELGEKAVHRVLSLYKDPKKTLYTRILRLFDGTGDYVTTFDTPYDPKLILCRYEDMLPLQRVPFEGVEVPIQNNYDSVMRNIYGDYMQLPPVEKRTTHRPVIMDFGEGNVIPQKTGETAGR